MRIHTRHVFKCKQKKKRKTGPSCHNRRLETRSLRISAFSQVSQSTAKYITTRLMFQGYTFLIVKSLDLDDNEVAKLEKILTQHNATKVYSKDEYDNSINYFDPPSITHIVTNSIDFIEYSPAQKSMIPIVTPEWVHNSVEQSTLLPIALFAVLITCLRETRSLYTVQFRPLVGIIWTCYPSTQHT